jgi:dCMP deaminase
MKEKFINTYMKVANNFAELSYAVRLKVGAVIVTPSDTVTYGYNGTPSGFDNTCEYTEYASDGSATLKTKREVLHAEMNALMKLARSNESGEGSAMFITHSPCIECAKGIYQAGITSVFYETDYRSRDGVEFLQQCGILVAKVNTN